VGADKLVQVLLRDGERLVGGSARHDHAAGFGAGVGAGGDVGVCRSLNRRRACSIGMTLALLNHLKPPVQGVVVYSARSSSGNVHSRRPEPSPDSA
jgi:hypothetical protein